MCRQIIELTILDNSSETFIILLFFLPCNFLSLVDQLVKNPPAKQETPVGKICWRTDRLPTQVFLGFPGVSTGKESACNVDLGLIPELGRFPGEGNSYPLQYSCLENSVDRGAW